MPPIRATLVTMPMLMDREMSAPPVPSRSRGTAPIMRVAFAA